MRVEDLREWLWEHRELEAAAAAAESAATERMTERDGEEVRERG